MSANIENTILSAHPTVFAVGEEYQIFIPVTAEAVVGVRVGDHVYWDQSNGILRSKINIHRCHLPAEVLDREKKYTVVYRKMIDRTPYFPKSEEPVELEYDFRPVGNGKINIFVVSDSHNNKTGPVEAAEKSGERIDLLVLNGDIPDHSGDIGNFVTVYAIASGITKGEIPAVFSRGNHDTRGFYAEEYAGYTPTDRGNTYYSFRVGSLWGLALDCGEDKDDDHAEYGFTTCFHDFRVKETEFLRAIVSDPGSGFRADGVEHRVVICHVPFSYIQEEPFDIEQDIYREWTELCGKTDPELMIYGHLHTAELWLPGEKTDAYGIQPCPAVISGKPRSLENGKSYAGDFTGTLITLGEGEPKIRFVDNLGNTREPEKK